MDAPQAQPLRRSTRLRCRPLRYAEVGTLTFPRENAWTMKWTMDRAVEHFTLAEKNKNMRLFHLGEALRIVLEKPAATAHYPEWRTTMGRILYKYREELAPVTSWAHTLSCAYWRQWPDLFHHPLWRDAPPP